MAAPRSKLTSYKETKLDSHQSPDHVSSKPRMGTWEISSNRVSCSQHHPLLTTHRWEVITSRNTVVILDGQPQTGFSQLSSNYYMRIKLVGQARGTEASLFLRRRKQIRVASLYKRCKRQHRAPHAPIIGCLLLDPSYLKSPSSRQFKTLHSLFVLL